MRDFRAAASLICLCGLGIGIWQSVALLTPQPGHSAYGVSTVTLVEVPATPGTHPLEMHTAAPMEVRETAAEPLTYPPGVLAFLLISQLSPALLWLIPALVPARALGRTYAGALLLTPVGAILFWSLGMSWWKVFLLALAVTAVAALWLGARRLLPSH